MVQDFLDMQYIKNILQMTLSEVKITGFFKEWDINYESLITYNIIENKRNYLLKLKAENTFLDKIGWSDNNLVFMDKGLSGNETRIAAGSPYAKIGHTVWNTQYHPVQGKY